MKKLLLPFPTFMLFAASAAQSFAAPVNNSLNTCDDIDGFKGLCNIFPNNPMALVGWLIQGLLAVAVLASLLFLILGGLKWVTSGGDKDKLESARKQIIAAIVGLVIAFAAYFIINLLLYFFGLGSLSNLSLPTLNNAAQSVQNQ